MKTATQPILKRLVVRLRFVQGIFQTEILAIFGVTGRRAVPPNECTCKKVASHIDSTTTRYVTIGINLHEAVSGVTQNTLEVWLACIEKFIVVQHVDARAFNPFFYV